MRVLIAGGTGLIGTALTQTLLRGGHEVVVLSRTPDRVTHLPRGVRLLRWDGRTSTAWATALDGADAVVNLVGESLSAGRWTATRKARILQSRLDAGAALVAALETTQRKPRVLVQASGVGIYGFHGAEPLDESAAPGADFLARVAVKWEASTALVAELGVRQVVIRSGVVLSRDGGALPRMALPFRFFVGGPVGSGRQYLPWIHLDDEVEAIRFLLEHPEARRVYNLTAPHPVTNREFGRALARVLRRPCWAPAPAFALRLLLGEMATLLLEGQNALPQRLTAAGYTFKFPTVATALTNLWVSTPTRMKM